MTGGVEVAWIIDGFNIVCMLDVRDIIVDVSIVVDEHGVVDNCSRVDVVDTLDNVNVYS